MTFWEVLGQGAVALYSLITLALVTLLVARTSKRVLGIQVSAIRAMLVVIGIFAMLGPVLVYFGEHTDLEGTSASNMVAVTVLMVGLALGVFALGLLALMVLEVIIPTGSTPPLRVMLTGWRARLRRTGRYVQIMVILFRRGLTAPLRGVLNVGPSTATTPPVMYSQPWSPTPSTTTVAPLLRTAKRSPARPLMNSSPPVAP